MEKIEKSWTFWWTRNVNWTIQIIYLSSVEYDFDSKNDQSAQELKDKNRKSEIIKFEAQD